MGKSKYLKKGGNYDNFFFEGEIKVDLSFIRAITFLPDERFIVFGGKGKYIYVYDVISKKLVNKIDNGNREIYSLASFPRKPLIVSGEDDKLVLWNLETRNLEGEFKGHERTISSVCVFPDEERIASGSFDSKIIIWSVSTKQIIHTLIGTTRFVTSIDVFPDGKKLVSADLDNQLIIWNTDNGNKINIIKTEGIEDSIKVFPDGKTILSGNDRGKYRIWNSENGNIEKEGSERRRITNVSIFPNGKKFIILDTFGKISIINTDDLSTNQVIDTDSMSINFLTNSKHHIVYADTNKIKIWKIEMVLTREADKVIDEIEVNPDILGLIKQKLITNRKSL